MIRDITLGQYYPAESVIHQLDPRTKLMLIFSFILSLFLTDKVLVYVVIAVLLGGVIALSKVPIRFILRGLKSIIFLVVLTVVFNIFSTHGQVIWTIWKIQVTVEGLLLATMMAMRLMLLIIGSSLLTLTTSPIALTDGIEQLLGPLKLIRFPAHEIAMMMTIALRFIPILLQETDKIMKAQMARGADFESGGIIKKAKNMLPLFIPLFISAFRHAYELAMAMEARGYRGGEGRTRMNKITFTVKDLVATGLMVIYLALIVGMGKWLS